MDTDCTGQPKCVDEENRLVISLATKTIGALAITTESTIACTDELEVWFESIDGGGKTLTVETLALDATDGKITLTVNDNATLITDTTD